VFGGRRNGNQGKNRAGTGKQRQEGQ